MARILVVDDEGDIRALSRRTLTSMGHTVNTAKDGNEALQWMNDHDYDLIILDIMMPEKNGIEVLNEMKQTPKLQSVPVIVFSALSPTNSNIAETETRADEYIEKPFTRESFIKKVEKILSESN